MRGKLTTLGIVTHAERAHIGTAAASEGSSVYESDRLSTESGGILRVRGRAITLQLDPESTLIVSSAAGSEGSVVAELGSGAVVFSSAPAGEIVVAANAALVRPAAKVATMAKIIVANRRELHIYAQRGALQFSYRDESKVIPEGVAYRVLLDPSEKEERMASGPNNDNKKPGTHRAAFVLLSIAIPAILIPVVIHLLDESPNKP